MKTATISGVPQSIQRDGWWMDSQDPKPPQDDPQRLARDMRGPLLLLALVAFGDAMVWHVVPGISLAVFGLCLIGAALLMVPLLSPQRAMLAGATALIAVAPVIELVQPISVFLMGIGLMASLCLIANVSGLDLPRAMRRFPLVASLTVWRSTKGLAHRKGPRNVSFKAFLTGWALPLGVGAIFLALLSGANPLLNRLGQNIDLSHISFSRLTFWLALAALVYACLSTGLMRADLTHRAARRQTVRQPGLINLASVTRSLLLFNALFAVQTLTDAAFLYGSSELPYGMTYAQYAHRGAYPLLTAALLAGLFAVLARPFTDENRLLRLLLLVWLGQTLLLVLASATRLDVYVEAYGLTRLRLAAAIWMGVVAAGLGIVFWQVSKRRETAWMLKRCTALGLAVLYICAFVNFDGLIARHNLGNDIPRDNQYVCYLGEGALPALAAHENSRRWPQSLCQYSKPRLSTPTDWREWGFRNWRLRNSLSASQSEVSP